MKESLRMGGDAGEVVGEVGFKSRVNSPQRHELMKGCRVIYLRVAAAAEEEVWPGGGLRCFIQVLCLIHPSSRWVIPRGVIMPGTKIIHRMFMLGGGL